MKIINRLRRFIGMSPVLRNKPGQLAYITSLADEGNGTGALVNRIVTPVRIHQGDFWLIEPPQRFCLSAFGGLVSADCYCTAVRDGALQPLKDPGEDAKDETAKFYPAVPAITNPATAPKPAEVS